jgi:hemolysin activation/secretion protein
MERGGREVGIQPSRAAREADKNGTKKRKWRALGKGALENILHNYALFIYYRTGETWDSCRGRYYSHTYTHTHTHTHTLSLSHTRSLSHTFTLTHTQYYTYNTRERPRDSYDERNIRPNDVCTLTSHQQYISNTLATH